MFSTAATRGRNSAVLSSWKLEASATTMPSAGKSSACSDKGVPILPPTSTGRTWARKSSPVSAVVVVLPFVPVMAMTSASIARQASSSSPTMGTPRARTRTRAGSVSGTPGLTTTSSASAKASSGWPPVQSAQPSRSSRSTSAESAARSAASEASTVPLTRRIRRAAATPLFASPTTETVLPASRRRYAGPRPVAPFMSSSSSCSQLAAVSMIDTRRGSAPLPIPPPKPSCAGEAGARTQSTSRISGAPGRLER